MFWTIWFWLGLLAGWVVTVGHCMNTWVSGFLFTIIVYFLVPTFPTATFLSLLTLYAAGIFIVATQFPFPICLLIYLSFLIPFFMAFFGRMPGGTRVVFSRPKIDERYTEKKSTKKGCDNEKGHEMNNVADIKRQLLKRLNDYQKKYYSTNPSKEELIIFEAVIDSCKQRLDIMSEDRYSSLYENAGGNIEIMALSVVDTVLQFSKVLVQEDAKRPENTKGATDALRCILAVESFFNGFMTKIIMGFGIDDDDVEDSEEPQDNVEDSEEPQNNAEDSEEPQDDDHPDGFEDVDLSEDEIKDTPAKKDKNRSLAIPLLIFFVVILSITAILLPIGTYAIGSESGYTKGYTTGHNDGEKKGKEEGYNEGYSDGQDDVDITEYYQDGYDDGYQQGYSNAYDVGWYDAIDGYGYLGNYGDSY